MEKERWHSRIAAREIYRYMGMKEQDADEALQRRVEEQLARLLAVCRVRSFYQLFPLRIKENRRQETASPNEGTAPLLELGPMTIASRGLARNLRGCDQAALFGVTLGLEADRLIYRLGQTAVGEALITDACAAAAIEAVCDELCETLRREAAKAGRKIRPRFSPGFGDFTLAYQPAIFNTLELSKRIGVTLTAGGMMTPSKSVTAVVGLYEESAGKPHAPVEENITTGGLRTDESSV